MMEKIARNLDFYDDPKGEILKKRFPTPDHLPQLIKEGSIMSPKELDLLPDNLFALVIKDGNSKIRKFACADKTSTALSVIYFMDHGHKHLPEELQKTAAANLQVACGWYGMEAPEALSKLAGDAARDSIDSVVDASTITIKPMLQEHSLYCLPKEAKYPIASYEQVTRAIEYFEKHAAKFEAGTRREYSKNLEKRAAELGIPLPPAVKHYASDTPSADIHVKEQLAARMHKTASEEHVLAYSNLLKISKSRDGISTETLAIALGEIDKVAGLDMHYDESVDDPWKTFFQIPKTAEYTFNDSTGYITEVDLKRITEFRNVLMQAFDEDMVNAYMKDPVEFFKALPLDKKRVIIQLAKTVRKDG